MRKMKLAPSILASDFLHLQRDLQLIEQSKADWLHVDIMDGTFVPNISFGPDITRSMKKVCSKFMDVHLMIENPERYIDAFVDAGADLITVHLEACPHLHRVIQQIHQAGVKAGVALNPHSHVQLVENVLEDLDLVLIMSVNPGFGGQKFIYQSIPKIKSLKKRLMERNLNALIEVDGGIGLQNAEIVLDAGADVIVAGSSILKSENPLQTIERFKEIGDRGSWV